MSSTPPTKLSALIDELSMIDDNELRADLLIEFAEKFKSAPTNVAVEPYPEENKVPACESDAYIWVTKGDDGKKLYPHFIVKNPQGISAKAMAAVMTEALEGEELSAYRELNDSIVDKIFGRTISMGKGQGLMGMVRLVKFLAEKA